jgi:DNA transposition AAA+ family ATPase
VIGLIIVGLIVGYLADYYAQLQHEVEKWANAFEFSDAELQEKEDDAVQQTRKKSRKLLRQMSKSFKTANKRAKQKQIEKATMSTAKVTFRTAVRLVII